MNWVERRANRERILASQSIEVWNDLRAAIQDACDSYNKEFADLPYADCRMETVRRIRVSLMAGHKGQVLIAFYEEQRAIEINQTLGDRFANFDFTIEPTSIVRIKPEYHLEAYACLMNKDQIFDADEASRYILEPLLFGALTQPGRLNALPVFP